MKTLGLLPMVLSRDEAASMWRSLGMTILFGTITGTCLTLLIVPVAYYSMDRAVLFIKSFFHKILGIAARPALPVAEQSLDTPVK
jgi:ABC-type Fe3+ transport system permease subunit